MCRSRKDSPGRQGRVCQSSPKTLVPYARIWQVPPMHFKHPSLGEHSCTPCCTISTRPHVSNHPYPGCRANPKPPCLILVHPIHRIEWGTSCRSVWFSVSERAFRFTGLSYAHVCTSMWYACLPQSARRPWRDPLYVRTPNQTAPPCSRVRSAGYGCVWQILHAAGVRRYLALRTALSGTSVEI